MEAGVDLPISDYIIKCEGKTLKNPFASMVGSKKPTEAKEGKVMVPEGSIIRVLKPEVQVEFPQKGCQVVMPFKEYQTVKVIKGFALKNFHKRCSFKDLVVSFDSVILSDDQRIANLEFTNYNLVVEIAAT